MNYLTKQILILILIVPISTVSAQWGALPGAVVEEMEFGAINYSQGYITAVGIGAIPENVSSAGQARANAIRAAKIDALRNLAELVNDVRINSETTIKMGVVESDVIKSGVNAILRGAKQVGDVKYLSDSSVEITMGISMGGILDLVFANPNQLKVSETSSEIFVERKTTQEQTPAPIPARTSEPVTGIIVDGRGLGVKPSMSPRVLTENGDVIYGPGSYPVDYAVAQGVVGYHKDPKAAEGDTRVKGNPLVIKAVGISGKLSTDLIISSNDAKIVFSYNKRNDFLGKCKVMFILD